MDSLWYEQVYSNGETKVRLCAWERENEKKKEKRGGDRDTQNRLEN